MQIRQDIKQGTQEWLDWRKKGLGGSDIASVMNLSPWKTIETLWLEKTGQIAEEDLSTNFIVQRGHALEPEARGLFEDLTGKEYWPCLFENPIWDFGRVSVDGYDGQESIIEIKCNGNKSHELALLNQIPPYYMAQIQYLLAISEAKVCHYISYNPEHATPLISFEVKPDKEMQKTILDKASVFWNMNVKSKIRPKSKEEEQQIKEPLIQEKIKRLKTITDQFKKLEEEKEKLEKEIKEYLSKNQIKKANFDNVFFSEIVKKGSVDYSKIPELSGVDLEKYRKGSTAYYKIEFKNEPEGL